MGLNVQHVCARFSLAAPGVGMATAKEARLVMVMIAVVNFILTDDKKLGKTEEIEENSKATLDAEVCAC